MEKLELTDKHEKKLIKMCNMLFPEYEKVKTKSKPVQKGEICILGHELIGFPSVDMGSVVDFIHLERVPWLEVCIRMIPVRLSDMTDFGDNADAQSEFLKSMVGLVGEMALLNGSLPEVEHPVDFLFDVVSALEKNSKKSGKKKKDTKKKKK